MELSIIKVEKDTPCYKAVNRLNIEAFPKCERVPTGKLLSFTKSGGEFIAFYDKNEFIGFSYFRSAMGLTYICFLAIQKEKRSMGYGRAILEKMAMLYPNNQLVLEIEPLDKSAENYEQRLRRASFYLSCGFKDSGYTSAYMGNVFDIYYKGTGFEIKRFYDLLDSMRGGKFQPVVTKKE